MQFCNNYHFNPYIQICFFFSKRRLDIFPVTVLHRNNLFRDSKTPLLIVNRSTNDAFYGVSAARNMDAEMCGPLPLLFNWGSFQQDYEHAFVTRIYGWIPNQLCQYQRWKSNFWHARSYTGRCVMLVTASTHSLRLCCTNLGKQRHQFQMVDQECSAVNCHVSK